MAQLFSIDAGLQDETRTEQRERLHITEVLRAIAIEHARAMSASGQAELQRRGLAELRGMYCSGSQAGSPDDVSTSR
jgi:hypothetical protein